MHDYRFSTDSSQIYFAGLLFP